MFRSCHNTFISVLTFVKLLDSIFFWKLLKKKELERNFLSLTSFFFTGDCRIGHCERKASFLSSDQGLWKKISKILEVLCLKRIDELSVYRKAQEVSRLKKLQMDLLKQCRSTERDNYRLWETEKMGKKCFEDGGDHHLCVIALHASLPNFDSLREEENVPPFFTIYTWCKCAITVPRKSKLFLEVKAKIGFYQLGWKFLS